MKRELIQFIWDEVDHLFTMRSVEGESTKAMVAQAAANIFSPGPNYYYVVDFVNPERFDYISPQMADILGINRLTFDVEEYFRTLHPDDLEHFKKCEAKIFDFIEHKIEKEDIVNYKYGYQFRMKGRGRYHHIFHQALTLSVDGFGRISKVLSIDTVVDHITEVNNNKLSIIGLNGAPSYLGIDVNRKDSQYEIQPQGIFSEREIQLIRLFADGRTAKEIAAFLNIAEGTVRTHRKNILKKSNCPNMTSLVARCIREGLI